MTESSGKSSLTAEMIGIYLAALVHNHLPQPHQTKQQTHTDCMAALKLYKVWSPHLRSGSEYFPLISHVSSMTNNIQWTPSHLEKKGPVSSWNTLDWSIAIADHIASGSEKSLHTRIFNIIKKPFYDISDHILSTATMWTWTKNTIIFPSHNANWQTSQRT